MIARLRRVQMPFHFQQAYPPDVEMHMHNCFQSLSEKDRRRYAAVEVVKLGHGGITYISKLFGCSAELITHGLQDLTQLPQDPAGDRIRQPGGGRKKTEVKSPEVTHRVQQTLQDRTAGDPMRQDLVWTDLTPREIADSLHKQDLSVGPRIVRRILDTLGFARRQIAKVLPGGETLDRDPQFRHLAHLIQDFQEAGNPILSIDTKKKEYLGTLYRDGQVYCQEALKAFDHDFASLAKGVIIPHGIYDLVLNHGWLHLGLSRDTTEFACDSLRLFWQHEGQSLYPNASAILLLCDGGGSNSCRKHLFKEDLQNLVNELKIPIRVAHYPAYCSKFNPIERRLFCHVTRACQGVLFDSLQTVVRLMQKTTTQTGLSVTVRVIDKLYETGRKVSDAFKQNMPIVFEAVLPKWNYWAVPQ
jgi:hypothetical protein